ncbi:MAG: hypothetical protein ACXWUG_16735 [Polyangiales bacterium]
MATRSEAARAEQQRENSRTSPTTQKRVRKRALAAGHEPAVRNNKHADRKATYVIEDRAVPSSRPSRKSTRKASNRMKESSPLDIREELRANVPSRVAERARARER